MPIFRMRPFQERQAMLRNEENALVFAMIRSSTEWIVLVQTQKGQLVGTMARFAEELADSVHCIFEGIPKCVLISVSEQWMHGIRWRVKDEGEYQNESSHCRDFHGRRLRKRSCEFPDALSLLLILVGRLLQSSHWWIEFRAQSVFCGFNSVGKTSSSARYGKTDIIS